MTTKGQTITLSLPEFTTFFSFVANLRSRFSRFHSNKFSQGFEENGSLKNKLKKFLPIGIVAFFVILTLGLVTWTGLYAIRNLSAKSSISVLGAKANQDINKEFSFPIFDNDGKEINRLKFEIESVELRDELIVKGQRARSVSGRTFLILNLKLQNNHNQGVQISTKDYIRLSVNGKDEWVAPEVHNDPVEVQAIATKPTRVGFAINNSDKDLKIRVGEINGKKEEIKLDLK